MTTQEAFALFRQKIKEAHALSHAMGVMYYDGDTAAPEESYLGRGETMEYLSGLAYQIETGEELKNAVDFLWEHRDELDFQQRREVEVFRRNNEYTASIPQDEYVAYVSLLNNANAVWHKAKLENDFASFAPYLKQIFDTNIRFAKYYKPELDPYDVQLDMYEKGLTKEKTDEFFEALKEKIVPLLHRVMEKPQVDCSCIEGKIFTANEQRPFSDYLMELITIDRKRCSIGETEHPYTTGFNKKDVRITTHYHEDSFLSSMYSVIHEGGHALYELHSGDELENTVLSGGVSMSIHESQSRFMENLIGRSRAFISAIYPKLCAYFPAQMAGVTPEQLYLAANKAEPSLIRTEADELTYALHVLVRYEIEKELFAGKLDVMDVPKAWNAKYKEYLGIDVPDDRRGCLQDSHWANGNVGYFPSYALGSAYGAQMLAKMKETVDVDGAVARGDLKPVADWLEAHIWKFGGLYDPSVLLEQALGAPFDPKFYTDYLEKKYTEIYDL